MNCMIVEDEPQAIQIIENHISHFTDLKVCSVHRNAMDAFLELQRLPIDILFLDIQLPKMSGIQLLHSLTHKPSVILTTAYREFALEGYELEISDYLLKPISLDRFAKAIARVYKNQKQPFVPSGITEAASSPLLSEPFIYVKCEREYVKILLKELQYIESIKNHIKLVTVSGTYITLFGLSQIEEKLPPQNFIRVHRSYIVALSHISKFTQTNVTIEDKLIPIGQLFKQKFLDWVKESMV